MHRKPALAVLLLALLCLLAACAGSAKPPVPCADVLAAMEQSQPFGELAPLSEKLIGKYLDVELTLVTDSAMAMDGTRATAEQIAVLTAADAEALATVKAALQTYLDSLLIQYRDYAPAEVPKLENAVLRENGLQIALVVCADASAADAALSAAWR